MADTGVPLVDCYPVPDAYVEGLGRVEVTGQNIRLIFFTARHNDDGTLDREIVQRIVLPSEAMVSAFAAVLTLPIIGAQILAAISEALVRPFGESSH